MKRTIIELIKGILIGISVLIPGLSGGTTAIILNVYQKILEAVSEFRKNKKENFRLLATIGFGGILGMFSASVPLKFIIEKYSTAFSYVVIGLIIGSIPIFLKDFQKNLIKNTIALISGFSITVLIEKLPIYILNDFSLIILGALSGISLILPGISITNILIIFGLYDEIIASIRNMHLFLLLKLGIYTFLSVILFTKALNFCYKKYPTSINMMISGMIIASIKQILPGLTEQIHISNQIALIMLGLAFAFCFAFFESRTNNRKRTL